MADKTMRFEVEARDKASAVFARVGQSVDTLARKLDELGRKEAKPRVTADTEQAKGRLVQLGQALRDLRNQRVRVDVDLGTARADVGDLRRELSYLRDAKVKVDVRTGTAKADLAAIAGRLRELRDAAVHVDVQTGGAEGRVALLHGALLELRALSPLRLVADLDDQVTGQVAALRAVAEGLGNAHVRIRVEVDAGDSAAELAALAALLERLDGTTRHRVEVDASGAAASAATAAGKIAALGAAALYAVPLLGSLTASGATLGGSLVSLAGVAGLLPGAFASGAVTAGALAVGLAHVGDALGETDTPAKLKKVNAAIDALSPSARAAVQEIRGFGPAWTTMRLDVQERLFRGVSGEVTALGGTYLPVLKTGLGGVADEFNLLGKDVSGFAQQASTVSDVNAIFADTKASLEAARPAATNLAAAFLDVAVVGTGMLPELAAGWTDATGRFREFIAQARQSGQLREWIQGGLDTLSQLGSIAGNTGSVLASTFRAAKESGADFLGTVDRVTEGVAEFLRSAEGQNTLVAFFTESRAAIDATLPGLETAGRSGAAAVAAFSDTEGLTRFGEAFSTIAKEAAPVLPMLGELAGGVLGDLANGASVAAAALGPVVGVAVGVVDALGPVAPLVVASVVAFRTFGLATASVVALGTAMQAGAAVTGTYTAGLTGSLAAGAAAQAGMTRLGGAVTALGRSLPLVGAAVVVLGFAFQAAAGDLDGWAKGMLAGGDAARKAQTDFEAHNAQFVEGSVAANLFGKSQADLTAELERQIATMGPLEQAQARANLAQTAYNNAVRDFGALSPQAVAAQAELSAASDRVTAAQRGAGDATKTHTDRMLEQQQAAFAASSTDLQYLDALDRVAAAQDRAAEAARNHSAGSRELEQANRDVLRANLDAAAAAGAKAEADAKATGASNAAEIGARAQKDELVRLAAQATGPTRDALLAMADGSDLAARASSTAEIQARLQKDELARLAGEASGPLREAINGALANFDTLGGAHATATQRAQAQKDELNRLAAMASGPLRTELLNMATQVNTLPDGDFTVTADGMLGEVRERGGGGHFASGGVLPGWTPGRDVHQFYSPTGGRLGLSGGEAVMRPEWTRAVGSRWVDGANKAARTGGVSAVAEFVARTAPRPSGLEGVRGDGSAYRAGGVVGQSPARGYALGGVVRTGVQPYQQVSDRDYLRTRQAIVDQLAPRMQARVRAAEAAAAGGGAASGPVTAGAQAGLDWAHTQVGKPYGWGAVGPGSYDCSGFMSAIVNVMRGRSPHSRVGATGSFPWAGFAAGIGPGLSVGAFRGSPGHMAGTIGGTNVESSGGVGVRVGGGARGAGHPMFTTRAHLADRGAVLAHRELALNLSGRPERVLSPAQTVAYDGGRTGVAQLRAMAGEIGRPALAAGGADRGGAAAAASMAGVEQRLDQLTQLLHRRGAGATIHVQGSGDPSETARSTVLALRLS